MPERIELLQRRLPSSTNAAVSADQIWQELHAGGRVVLLRRPSAADSTEIRIRAARLGFRADIHVEQFLLFVNSLTDTIAAEVAIHAGSGRG